MNPYEILGVKKDAKPAEIKSAYRKLSSTAHPDKEGGSAEAFHELKEAYDILKDPSRRQRYDATGRTRPSPVTPSALSKVFAQIMKTVVASVDADDPCRADIKRKILGTLLRERQGIQDQLFMANQKLERATRLLERFETSEEFDPIGVALKEELGRVRGEVAAQEDLMEISEELERIMETYEYNVDPQPEGQHSWGPTTIQVFRPGGSYTTMA